MRGGVLIALAAAVGFVPLAAAQDIVGVVAEKTPILAVAFAPDGQSLAVAGRAGLLRRRTLAGALVGLAMEADNGGHDGSVLAVAFSPDGRYLVSGGEDGVARTWLLSGSLAFRVDHGHGSPVRAVAFVPGRPPSVVSAAHDGSLQRAPFEGKASWTINTGKRGVAAVAVSPDGRRIATGGDDGTVGFWTADGRPMGTPQRAHAGGVAYLAFLADGSLVSASAREIRGWATTMAPLGGRFALPTGFAARSIAVAVATDIVVAVNGEGRILAWTTQGAPRTVAPVQIAVGPAPPRIALSPDGRLLAVTRSTGREGAAFVYRLAW